MIAATNTGLSRWSPRTCNAEHCSFTASEDEAEATRERTNHSLLSLPAAMGSAGRLFICINLRELQNGYLFGVDAQPASRDDGLPPLPPWARHPGSDRPHGRYGGVIGPEIQGWASGFFVAM
jgi:hypothetical protein